MKGYLCDTHIVLWAATDPIRLGTQVQSVLQSYSERVFVSAVSIAEMAIKQELGKLQLPDSMSPVDLCEAIQFEPLPLVRLHASALAQLPPIHRDPFDRLLLVQAIEEDLILITADAVVASYPGVQVLRVH